MDYTFGAKENEKFLSTCTFKPLNAYRNTCAFEYTGVFNGQTHWRPVVNKMSKPMQGNKKERKLARQRRRVASMSRFKKASKGM